MPAECFNKNLVLPHHLQQLLDNLDLKLSSKEFQKLWNKFDINYTGCCRINIFLRLINYKSVDEDQTRFQMYKSKSFIVDKFDLNNQFSSNYLTVPLNTSRSNRSIQADEKIQNNEENNLAFDNKTEVLDEIEEIEEETVQNLQKPVEENKDQELINDLKLENRTKTSLSEAKIKSMVKSLKKTNEFGSKNDIVSFLNNKLNEGLIVLRTAFEYIDQDQIGNLLAFEFRGVLEEFKILMDTKLMNKFLRK